MVNIVDIMSDLVIIQVNLETMQWHYVLQILACIVQLAVGLGTDPGSTSSDPSTAA